MEAIHAPAVMGIVNVTGDSFYDGGCYIDKGAAVEHALRLAGEGADIIDIGGASTRPGAELLPADEEIARVVPVIDELVKRGVNVPISVDTVWSRVAAAAVDAGASWVNDISAGRIDAGMPAVVAKAKSTVVLTHSRGTPKNMQDDPRYGDVAGEVARELTASVDAFRRAGVDGGRIVVDPGFGFAKSAAHNVELLCQLGRIVKLGYPVMAGLSRKSFIGALVDRPAEERLWGSLGALAAAYAGGARIFRVHDVKETVDFLKAMAACYPPLPLVG